MHVLIVSEYSRPWPGGISEHVHEEAERLFARGHRVSVLSGPGAERARFSPGITSHALRKAVHFGSNGSSARMSFDRRILGVSAFLRSLAPDVVHVHAPFDPMLPLAVTLCSPAPVVGTFHASFSPTPLWDVLYHRRAPWIARAVRRLRATIAVSEEAHRSIARYVDLPCEIVPNGVDSQRFTAKGERSARSVLFVGRPDPRKGLGDLFSAFSQIPDATLSVVGPVEERHQRRLLGRLSPEQRARVRFFGYVPPEAMPAHFASARVLCAPSTEGESQGIVLLEAMAAGAMVVACDIPGYRAVLQNGSGLLVPPHAPHALAAALRRALDDDQLRARTIAAGEEIAKAFRWDAVIPRIEQVLKRARA